MSLMPLFPPIIYNKMTVLEVNDRVFDNLFFQPGLYCRDIEIKILSWTLQQLVGDYIELGVNQGATAINICRNNPKKKIWGVDFTESIQLHEGQKSEQPNSETIGLYCKDEPNFTLLNANSWNVKMPDHIGMVFIDANHSYEGVKKDTENVFRQINPGTIIFWHDYHYENVDLNHMAVNAYIDNEVIGKIPNMPIYQFKNTWLIVGRVP